MSTDDHLAFLSLGSNISPEQYLPAAVARLREVGTVLKTSQVWQSAPVGDPNQPDYCNAAVLFATSLAPADLKQTLREIERQLGRHRDPQQRCAPRTIDIDLTLYDELDQEFGGGRVPDPELFTRPFVAGPLAELSPEYRVPGSNRTLAAIADALGHASLSLRVDIPLDSKSNA